MRQSGVDFVHAKANETQDHKVENDDEIVVRVYSTDVHAGALENKTKNDKKNNQLGMF